MGKRFSQPKLKSKNLEGWLEQTLVPVEPNPQFIQHLRAKLIRVRGDRTLHPWLLITAGLTTILLMATWMSVAMRILVGVLSLLGILQRTRGRKETIPS